MPMTSAAAATASVPRKIQHSSGTVNQNKSTSTATPYLDPRSATSQTHVSVSPDVTPGDHHFLLSPPAESLTNHYRGTAPNVDKVDSQSVKTSASSVKLRAHSRLASFGRIRSKGNIKQQSAEQKLPASKGETLPAEVPVSPSDAGSHQRSDYSTLSNSSSKTTLSDHESPLKDQTAQPSFLLGSNNVPSDRSKTNGKPLDSERPQRLAPPAPRTMHQTSSKLLRMTDDDRPFTRVR